MVLVADFKNKLSHAVRVRWKRGSRAGISIIAAAAGVAIATNTSPGQLDTMRAGEAVMVTEELNFGAKIPTIPEALNQIERRYVTYDGKGRTFAILDAFGEQTADHKLHISMHVSAEKPGMASLVFRRTGDVIWSCRIVPGSRKVPVTMNLGIFVDDGKGKSLVVDGSGNPRSILQAKIQDIGRPVRDLWPKGAVREVTFIYSACGCPVKVMVKRVGERTARAKASPVIFPDDPAVVSLINRLMMW